MIAPVRWRGLCIAVPALITYSLLKGIDCRCGGVVAGAITALQLLAMTVGAIGVLGYIRWYSKRKRGWPDDLDGK